LMVGIILCLWDYTYHFNDFFHLGPGGIWYLTGLNLIAIWFANWLVNHVSLTRVMPVINYCSRHVTTLYIMQWIIVCWGMAVVGYQQLSPMNTFLLMPVMIGIILAVHYTIHKFMKRKNQPVMSDLPSS